MNQSFTNNYRYNNLMKLVFVVTLVIPSFIIDTVMYTRASFKSKSEAIRKETE